MVGRIGPVRRERVVGSRILWLERTVGNIRTKRDLGRVRNLRMVWLVGMVGRIRNLRLVWAERN